MLCIVEKTLVYGHADGRDKHLRGLRFADGKFRVGDLSGKKLQQKYIKLYSVTHDKIRCKNRG